MSSNWSVVHSEQIISIGKNCDFEITGNGTTIGALVFSRNNNISVGDGSIFHTKSTLTATSFSPIYAGKDILTGKNSYIQANFSGSGVSVPLVRAVGNIIIGPSSGGSSSDTTQFVVTSSTSMGDNFIRSDTNLTVNDGSKVIINPQNTSTTYSIYMGSTSGKFTVGNNSSVIVNSPGSGTSNHNGIYVNGSGGLQIGNTTLFTVLSTGMNSSNPLINLTNGPLTTGVGSSFQTTASGECPPIFSKVNWQFNYRCKFKL